RKEYDAYVGFYKELGVVLKEGVAQDWGQREKLADLLLFESTRTEPGKFTTLGEYVERMPVSQKEIYYLTGESRELIEHSPLLEAAKAAGREVLLLTDPIDEFILPALPEYKGKKLQAVDRGELEETAVDEEKKKRLQPLCDYVKGRLGELKAVRLSNRLKESAACLVADEGALGAHLERLMARMGRGQELPPSRKILELNADHPAVEAMATLLARAAN